MKSEVSITDTDAHVVADAIERLADIPRPAKRALVMALDALLCIAAGWIAFFLRLGEWSFFSEGVLTLIAGSCVMWFIAAWATGVYSEVFRFARLGTFLSISRAIGLMLVPMIGIFLIAFIPGVPRTLSVLQPLVLFLLLISSRMLLRYIVLDLGRSPGQDGLKRVLIYGAGNAGQRLASSIRHEPSFKLVGFVDDDVLKHGHRLDNLRIHHSGHLPTVIANSRVTDIYLAIPRLSRFARARITEGLAQHPVQVMTLPDVREIIEGDVSINSLRDVEVSDLLGRPPVAPDAELMARTISGKTVMVTGAGGSIGGEICTQIAALQPVKIILVESSEFALYSIDSAIASLAKACSQPFEVVPELCNVSDRPSISRIMARHRPDTVFHTAAYKHVPLFETNEIGGTRNNILGTKNTVDAAIKSEVANFILISTDKAVRPTNLMGATKRVCEQILQAYADDPGANHGTVFAMVRFGNVLGSSGSVVPLFKRQIGNGGPITITDMRITRYFMTIPEAAELVIQAGAMAEGGEVYVLDMGPSVKIVDLARTMVRLSGLVVRDGESPLGDIEIIETGLRPGEKLYEELLIGGNAQPTSHERIMQARESFFKLPELVGALAELEDLLDSGDALAVRKLLKKLVPEYAPNKNSST